MALNQKLLKPHTCPNPIFVDSDSDSPDPIFVDSNLVGLELANR